MLPEVFQTKTQVMKRKLSVTVLFLSLSVILLGQSIFEPNYALKSPRTLNIVNVDANANATTITFSIENQAEGGFFCIDRNTLLVTPSGEKLKLMELTGLPYCPDNFRFKRIGEMKYFTMKFPPLPASAKWFSITEICNENCLFVIGLSLDAGLNAKLNLCFRDIEKGRTRDAITKFEELRGELAGSGNPILGSVYLNLITLYGEAGERSKSDALRAELGRLQIPSRELFVENSKRQQ